MPSRIKFAPEVARISSPEIAAGLVPLADSGYEVLVEPYAAFDWGVRVSRPGVVKAFRTRAATPTEWATFVAKVLST